LGLEPVFSGSNLAVDQAPAAGTQVKSGSRVTVQFGTPPPAKAGKAANAGKSHKTGQR
jgi:beta-lactam-binding protein with PASTA domain